MRIAIVGVVLGTVVFSLPVSAHHGTNISYDHDKPVTLNGTVTEFVFSNPHAQLYFDVKDDKGNLQHWAGELTSPYNLAQGGWTKKRSEKELIPGTELTIELWPSKAGTTAGVVTSS